MFFRTIILNQSPVYFYKQFLKSINTHNHNTRITSNGYLKPPTPRTVVNNYHPLGMFMKIGTSGWGGGGVVGVFMTALPDGVVMSCIMSALRL